MSALREVKLASVHKLLRSKHNPRTHSKKQIRQIANCILRFGWTYPILIDDSGVIVAGHCRYDAALQLGLLELPVIVIAGHLRSKATPRSRSRSIARITRSKDFGMPVRRSYDSGLMPYRLIESPFGGHSARKSAHRSPMR